MLKIAICDDDENCRKQIRQLINKAIFSRCDFVVTEFKNGKAFCNAVQQKNERYDLLLLDIHMPETDGMRLADYIRKDQLDLDIIFITVSQTHVYEGYLYKAFSYILKPLDETRFVMELNRYLDERERVQAYLNINVKGVINKIPIRKIMYFESNMRKVIAHLLHEDVEFYGKLDDIQEALEKSSFFRCHQSYLINKDFITAISRTEVTIGDRIIPVSRKYQAGLQTLL